MFTSIACVIFVIGCTVNQAESTLSILPDEPYYIDDTNSSGITLNTFTKHRIGSVQDVDSVISHFLDFRQYLRYFKSNFYHIKNTWLKGYPEYESYHYIVQAMIYAHIECVISWKDVNSLFMIFSNLRPILQWKVDLVSIVNNTFNPCKWNGVKCDKLSKLKTQKKYTYASQQTYPNLYINDLDIRIPKIASAQSRSISIYFNYSLPGHLRTLSLRNLTIYHFRLWSMPKWLEMLKIVSCKFAQNDDFSFEWNSIPSQLRSVRISQSITPPKFWTSDLQKNFSTIIKIDNTINSTKTPSWFKPKLEFFSIKDCPVFENDVTSLIMHQFLNKIYIMAPNLVELKLEKLKLHGIVDIRDFKSSNCKHTHFPKNSSLLNCSSVSFVKSGMDIIEISAKKMWSKIEQIMVESFYSQVVELSKFNVEKAETEYNEYLSLEKYLKRQYSAQEYADGSEVLLSNQDVEYISNKLKTISNTLNGISHWVENPAAFVSAKQHHDHDQPVDHHQVEQCAWCSPNKIIISCIAICVTAVLAYGIFVLTIAYD